MVLDIPTLSRAARLARLQHLLFRNARGLTTAELAGLTSVCRRTIERDVLALGDMGIPLWQKGHRYGISSDYYLPPVHLTLQEAGVLFLAARLLCRYSDEHNPHVVDALSKLAGILPDSVASYVQRAAAEMGTRPENPQFIAVFEALVLGWANRRRVRIWHQSARSGSLREYVFEPYAIEPMGAGSSTYAIGFTDFFHEVRTFKVERIKRVELLEETFEVPEDFDLPTRLASSWGIVWGDEEIEVRARFSPRVSRRLKETVWHSSQTVEDQPDGSSLFSVRVGSTLEIAPWLRSWGPDCEVLAPEFLREEMARWARETAGVYGE